MRNKLLTIWAAVLIGAIGAAVQGRVAVMIDELESGPLAKLYARSIAPSPHSAEKLDIQKEARELYRAGKCQSSEDLYRLSALLSGSENSTDLLLAHDCALASLIEGFRPSLKAVQASQKRFLHTIGHLGAADTKYSKRLRPARKIRILERLEASWSEAAKSNQQHATSRIALPVVN